MATTVETLTINKLNTLNDSMIYTPAGSIDSDGSATFEAQIDAADGRWFMEIDNTDGDTDAVVTLKSGAYVGAATVAAGTVAAGHTAILFADSAVCKSSDGRIQVYVKPASEIKVRAVQLLPAKCN